MVIDQGRLEEFLGKAINEWGAAYDALLIFIGDKLGLYNAMINTENVTHETRPKNRDSSKNGKRMA